MHLKSSNSKQLFFHNPFTFIKYGFFLAALWVAFPIAHAVEVTFAGFAYSGDYQSIAGRFPYSKQYEVTLGSAGINGLLQKTLPYVHPQNYTLVPRIDELQGRDQAIAVALVMTNEVVSTEHFGSYYKLFAQLRGQAMFFDFKSKTVIRSYPFSFAYIEALESEPTEAQKVERIGYVYNGASGKPGILERFAQALNKANLPSNVPHFVQVTNVNLAEGARTQFPAGYGNGAAEAWVADTFAEALSNKMGIPILPYAKGYAIGSVMSMTVADGTVFNLTLPEPDYQFTVNISNLKKILYSEKAAGKSYIYGTFADLKLEEPLLPKTYLNSPVKNGEVKVVPANQVNIEDFPAFQESMRGLFTKLSSEVAGEKTPWLKSAADASDIENQIASTRELLKSCK